MFWARDYAEQGLARTEVYEAVHDGLHRGRDRGPAPHPHPPGIEMPKARVYVTLKKSVFDPQGRTIHEALRSMGYDGVADVRQGKFFEVDLESMPAERARETVDEIARRVLANPVIESYRVEVEP
jgi:phosphoribosylformylglycinamidine synthase